MMAMREQKWIGAILIVALILRLAVAFTQDQSHIYQNSGGDSGWYLANGYALVSGWYEGHFSLPGTPDVQTPIYLPNIPTAPLYLILIGISQHIFSPGGAIIAIRVLQAIIGTATVYFVYGMAEAVARSKWVGLVAAGVVAISPVFVLESAQILTETTYIFFIAAGLWAYVQFVQRTIQTSEGRYRLLAVAGGFLGLAVLTRAVLILFPLGLALHLMLVSGWRKGLQRAVVLLSTYLGIALIWTVFNLLMWHQLVIGAQGFAAFLYLGSTPAGWQGPTQVDAALAQQSGGVLPSDPNQQQDIYQSSAVENITSNLPGWLKLRTTKLASAYLQPHGTTFFPGESLKDLAVTWIRSDRTINGLIQFTRSDSFWPKLVIYILHYTGLLAGLAGMWLTRRNWRITLPLIGFILYTSLIHFVLDALPRYLFPMEPFWWIFAAAMLVAVVRRGAFESPAASPAPG